MAAALQNAVVFADQIVQFLPVSKYAGGAMAGNPTAYYVVRNGCVIWVKPCVVESPTPFNPVWVEVDLGHDNQE